MATWSGQDWALLLGGITVLVTGVGGFITNMVTLSRLGIVAQKVDGMLVTRDASNKADGVIIGRQQGDDAAAQRAVGRQQQRDINRTEGPNTLSAPTPNGVPLPVADDRTAVAAEKGAAATVRLADAVEKETK